MGAVLRRGLTLARGVAGGAVLVAALVAGASPAGATGGRRWNLTAIDASAGWRAARGAGQVVAVIDSGIDLGHPAFAGRLVPGHDFVDDDDSPADLDGHGTHVAGVVAEVAPAAAIMPVRVLDGRGEGSIDDAVAAVRWAVHHGATVLNLSVGGDSGALAGPRVTAALEWAWRRGVVPVLASADGPYAPDGFDGVPIVVVTATTAAGRRAGYAPAVGDARWAIAAPGGDRRAGVWASGLGGGESALTGTSMAAPHVAGALAVLRSAGLAPHEAVIRLLATARDLGPAGRDPAYGSGELDLGAAVRDLVVARPPEVAGTSLGRRAPGDDHVALAGAELAGLALVAALMRRSPAAGGRAPWPARRSPDLRPAVP